MRADPQPGRPAAGQADDSRATEAVRGRALERRRREVRGARGDAGGQGGHQEDAAAGAQGVHQQGRNSTVMCGIISGTITTA